MVEAGSQSNAAVPAARYSHSQSRFVAGRRGALVPRQSANRIKLGAFSGTGSAIVRAQAVGAARYFRCGIEEPSIEDSVGRRNRQRISNRALDRSSEHQTQRVRIWLFVKRRACIADYARTGLLHSTSDWMRGLARRNGDPGMESPALAGAKKPPEEKVEPSSSSTNLAGAGNQLGSEIGRPKVAC